MAIPSSRYVDIVSSVGGAAQIAARALGLRLFTPNGGRKEEVQEFTSADAIGLEFGFSSPEYLIAIKYFGFVSKQGRSPKTLQIALWSQAVVTPSVVGGPAGLITEIQAITNVDITATLNGTTAIVGALDLTVATDFDDAAAIIQVALRAADPGATAWTCVHNAGTGAYTIADPTTPTVFNTTAFVCADVAAASALGLETDELTITDATIIEAPLPAVSFSAELDNNFGSFMFIKADGSELSKAEILTLAEWTHGRNVEFQYHFSSPLFDSAFFNDIQGFSGVGVTYQNYTLDEFHEVVPCAVLAATDYTSPAASQNYMFQQLAGLTPSVTTEALADSLDAIRANYYGKTQESGTNVSFYQRGILMGLSNAPLQMGVFANEQSLKSYLKAQFLSLELALPQIPADATGIALGATVLADAVAIYLANGVISGGKVLTNTQIQTIIAITGNTTSWKQVQSTGYLYEVKIVTEVVGQITEYILDYTLIYSKRDSVNKVTGRHILI